MKLLKTYTIPPNSNPLYNVRVFRCLKTKRAAKIMKEIREIKKSEGGLWDKYPGKRESMILKEWEGGEQNSRIKKFYGGLYKKYFQDLIEYDMKAMIKKYYFPNLLSVDMADLFISRYKIDSKGEDNKDVKTMSQPALGLHRDSTFLSFVLQLNDSSEYDGGGTYYKSVPECNPAPGRYCGVKLRPGQIIFHSGKLLHSGLKITRGERYIVAGFIKLHTDDIAPPIRMTTILHHANTNVIKEDPLHNECDETIDDALFMDCIYNTTWSMEKFEKLIVQVNKRYDLFYANLPCHNPVGAGEVLGSVMDIGLMDRERAFFLEACKNKIDEWVKENDFILTQKKLLSEEQCKFLVKYFDEHVFLQDIHPFRNIKCLFVDQVPDDFRSEEIDKCIDAVMNAVKGLLECYKEYGVEFKMCPNITIERTYPGIPTVGFNTMQGTIDSEWVRVRNMHCDPATFQNTTMAWCVQVYLNNDGGSEKVFKNYDVEVKPGVGKAVCYPYHFQYINYDKPCPKNQYMLSLNVFIEKFIFNRQNHNHSGQAPGPGTIHPTHQSKCPQDGVGGFADGPDGGMRMRLEQGNGPRCQEGMSLDPRNERFEEGPEPPEGMKRPFHPCQPRNDPNLPPRPGMPRRPPPEMGPGSMAEQIRFRGEKDAKEWNQVE